MIELTDDGTLDTVLRCSVCGEEMRYNYAARISEATDEGKLSQGAWIGHFQKTIYDVNGNDIGRYAVKRDDCR